MTEKALVFTQNTDTGGGIEYSEAIVNPPGVNSLIGFSGIDNEPMAFATDNGVVISNGKVQLDVAVQAAGTLAGTEGVFVIDGTIVKQTTIDDIRGGADTKVSAEDGDTPGVLNDVLAVSGALTKNASAGVVTLGVAVAGSSNLGVVQIGANIANASGTISVATASTSAKGVAQFNSNHFVVATGIVSVKQGTNGFVRLVSVPAAETDPGQTGDVAFGDDYGYAYLGTKWKKFILMKM